MSLFELGDVVMTSGVAGIVEERDGAFEAVLDCLQRHSVGDWGNLCEDDREMNDAAIEAERDDGCTDRLFSAYETDFGRIYIITEYDRSATTILLPEEYRA